MCRVFAYNFACGAEIKDEPREKSQFSSLLGFIKFHLSKTESAFGSDFKKCF